MRFVAWLALAWSTMGCEAASSVDLHYVMKDASVNADGSGQGDAQGDAIADGAQPRLDSGLGEGGACDCNFSSGDGCCVQKTKVFCAMLATDCTAGGGAFVTCTSTTMDGECCWNGGAGAGGSTALASACNNRPRMCLSNSDCVNETCHTVTCKGITMGACGSVTPTCP